MPSRLLYHSLLLLAWIIPAACFGQEYSYTQYNTKDGLAGSVVHGMVQDRDGFIWITTETGLSRFDGIHFKNFTTADGLPANEVYGTFCDSKNRIWIVPFKNSICYYLNGKIHNSKNDSILKKIQLKGIIIGLAEDEEGNILLREWNERSVTFHYLRISLQGAITEFTESAILYSSKQWPLIVNGIGSFVLGISGVQDIQGRWKDCQSYPFPDKQSNAKCLWIKSHDSIFYFRRTQAQLRRYRLVSDTFVLHDVNKYRICLMNDHVIAFMADSGGVQLIDVNDHSSAIYLPEFIVQFVFEDADKNLWLSTKGGGVFRFNNTRFRNYYFDNLAVRDIRRVNDRIYIGTDNKKLWRIQPADSNILNGHSPEKPQPEIQDIKQATANINKAYINYAGSDFLNIARQLSVFKYGALKTIQVSGDTLFCALNTCAICLRKTDLKLLHRVFTGRTTCVYHQDSNYYVGTVNGLYRIIPGQSSAFLGNDNPLFRNHISWFAESSDGVLWIATYGSGIIGYKQGKIVANIRQINGLASDVCRCLYVDGNTLWAGTDKGLNKINVTPGKYAVIQRFTEADGLSANVINTVYSEGRYVYVGTALGLNVFDETRIPVHAGCNLVLTGITVSGKERSFIEKDLVLRHRDNNIRFEYSGISFPSGMDIRYQYRLLGLNDDWQYTKEHILSYPTLPSGSYTLQLIAINKFGDKSRMIEYRFEIEKQIWETWWFQLAALLLIIGVTAWVVRYSIRRSNIKEREKLLTEQKIILTEKKMTELEQMALRAQMNPHFIFNCLNSMQRYILKQDVKSANFYLSRFAGLVRQTLDNSTRVYIPLVEEIRYLTNYLELERLQLAENFSYTITADEGIDQDQMMVPNMVLQPYVENAIKHGMRHLDKPGRITIHFKLLREDKMLECVIEDNGRGIAWTREQLQRHPSGHQSKGMSITDQRVKTLNQLNDSGADIEVRVTDVLTDNKPGGTRVTVLFPLQA